MSNFHKNSGLRVRCAVVGLGGFGAARRRMLRESGAFELAGGVELVDETFDRAAAEEGGHFRRYATVSEAAADVEAVFICTPAHLHCDQAMEAASLGRAVFVEKPLSHDLEAARELVEYCEERHIPHGHGFTMRHSASSLLLRELIEKGICGRIASVSATSMHSGGFAYPDENWRFLPGRNPGGPLFQCGIHKIDLLRSLFGEGEWSGALASSDLSESQTEDSYALLGRFGGISCTLHCHYVTAYSHGLSVFGTGGNLYVSDFPTKVLWQKRSPNQGVEKIEDLGSMLPLTDGETVALREFATAVREHRQPQPNGRDGLAALELVFSAVALAQGGFSVQTLERTPTA